MPYSKQLTPDDELLLNAFEMHQYQAFRDAAYGNDMLCALIYNETLVTVTQRRLQRAMAERDALQHAMAERDALQAEVSQLRHALAERDALQAELLQDLATLRVLAMRY